MQPDVNISDEEKAFVAIDSWDAVFNKFVSGFRYEISSAEFFITKKLYNSIIVETILYGIFGALSMTFVIIGSVLIAIGASMGMMILLYVGCGVEVLSFLCALVFMCIHPIIIDVYNRISDKTERIILGQDIETKSGPRVNKDCANFAVTYILTGLLETVVFLPIFLLCFVTLIIPPLGIVLLILLRAYRRAWNNFKVVHIRHGRYWDLWKFMTRKEVLPYAFGIGSGYVCINRILGRTIPFGIGRFIGHLVTVVSTTRFYIHYYYVLGRSSVVTEKQNLINDTETPNSQPIENVK